jgi:O-acetyl-ADP-ribose deacetylase (regulator of RNase III)
MLRHKRPRESKHEHVVKKPRVSISEVKGDLFSVVDSNTWSLAHCVSACFHMNKGIAKTFKKRFGSVQDLLEQKKTPGSVAVLKHQDNFIYYLVTKEKFYQKPTMKSLEKSLVEMRDHCVQNNVTRLAMPRIGCGLDKLDWNKVQNLVSTIFQDTSIEIRVFIL